MKGIIALYWLYFRTNVVLICIFAWCVFTVLYGVFWTCWVLQCLRSEIIQPSLFSHIFHIRINLGFDWRGYEECWLMLLDSCSERHLLSTPNKKIVHSLSSIENTWKLIVQSFWINNCWYQSMTKLEIQTNFLSYNLRIPRNLYNPRKYVSYVISRNVKLHPILLTYIYCFYLLS